MSSPNDGGTLGRLRAAGMAHSTETSPEERPSSPTMPRNKSSSGPRTDQGVQEEDNYTSCGCLTATAKTQNRPSVSEADKNIASEFEGLCINRSPRCVSELPNEKLDERVSTPDKEGAYGAAMSRPAFGRYDTDDYGDYPDVAPKSPREEEGNPPVYPAKSPLATPSVELRTSPYFQEHGISAPLTSSVSNPPATVSTDGPTSISLNEDMCGEDVASSRYAGRHKRLGDNLDCVPQCDKGAAQGKKIEGYEKCEEVTHEEKRGFVKKVAHMLDKDDSKEKHPRE